MSFLATTLGAKVAIAALSLAAVGGGAAVAATVVPIVPAASPAGDAVTIADETTAPTDPATDPAESLPAAKGPDAAGESAFGLCTAFAAGGLSTSSVAYTALVSASAEGDVDDYCAPILAAHPADVAGHGPTSTPSHTPEAPTTHGPSDAGQEHGDADSHRP